MTTAPEPTKERLLYHLVTSQGPRVRGRVFLNDLPVYEDPKSVDFESTTRRVNNFLVPGPNTLRVEVDEMGDESSSMFWAQILRDPDENVETEKYHHLKWPEAAAELPEPLPTPVPFVWENELTIEASHPKPYYADVKSEQVPLEGTDELRGSVKEIHDALAGRDAAKMTDLTWFEAQDSARYYPHLPPPSKGTIAAAYTRGFDGPWDVPDWNPDRLLFTKRASGRLVHVTAVDGRHAITGRHTQRPDAHFLLNPLLVRHQGRWTMYR